MRDRENSRSARFSTEKSIYCKQKPLLTSFLLKTKPQLNLRAHRSAVPSLITSTPSLSNLTSYAHSPKHRSISLKKILIFSSAIPSYSDSKGAKKRCRHYWMRCLSPNAKHRHIQPYCMALPMREKVAY